MYFRNDKHWLDKITISLVLFFSYSHMNLVYASVDSGVVDASYINNLQKEAKYGSEELGDFRTSTVKCEQVLQASSSIIEIADAQRACIRILIRNFAAMGEYEHLGAIVLQGLQLPHYSVFEKMELVNAFLKTHIEENGDSPVSLKLSEEEEQQVEQLVQASYLFLAYQALTLPPKHPLVLEALLDTVELCSWGRNTCDKRLYQLAYFILSDSNWEPLYERIGGISYSSAEVAELQKNRPLSDVTPECKDDMFISQKIRFATLGIGDGDGYIDLFPGYDQKHNPKIYAELYQTLNDAEDHIKNIRASASCLPKERIDRLRISVIASKSRLPYAPPSGVEQSATFRNSKLDCENLYTSLSHYVNKYAHSSQFRRAAITHSDQAIEECIDLLEPENRLYEFWKLVFSFEKKCNSNFYKDKSTDALDEDFIHKNSLSRTDDIGQTCADLVETIDRKNMDFTDTNYSLLKLSESSGKTILNLTRTIQMNYLNKEGIRIRGKELDLLKALPDIDPLKNLSMKNEFFKLIQILDIFVSGEPLYQAAIESTLSDVERRSYRQRENLVDQLLELDQNEKVKRKTKLLASLKEVNQVLSNTKLQDIEQRLKPKALEIARVQKLLNDKEALSVIVSADEFGAIIFISKDSVKIRRLPHDDHWVELARKQKTLLSTTRAEVSRGLTLNNSDTVSTKQQARECKNLLKLSSSLYAELFYFNEMLTRDGHPKRVDILDGLEDIIIVSYGAVSQISFNALNQDFFHPSFTSASCDESTMDAYRNARWLGKEKSITFLPSVASLEFTRGKFSIPSAAMKDLIGFGNPVFDVSVQYSDSLRTYSQGEVDSNVLSNLSPLPETEQELNTISSNFPLENTQLYFRERANEEVVKSEKLGNYKYLVFATHGLVKGDLSLVSEPSLALTPPLALNELNNGLLSLTEILTLNLDADMTVLSACNTGAISEGKYSKNGLTSMASAFMFAGSRSILATKWPIYSQAAIELTTGIFQRKQKNKENTAKALRSTIADILFNAQSPVEAHPSYWAPMIAIGE